MDTDRTRTLLHTRLVEFRCYRRGDGFWEIEGELRDLRGYDTVVPEKGQLPAGAAVHHMTITVVVDEDLVVRDVVSRMNATPFRVCGEVEGSLKRMIGVRMAYGWRHAINERLGGERSCTHLRELLTNMATAALQAIPTWQAQDRKRQGLGPTGDSRPHYLGQCHAWRLDGPIVHHHFPQFRQPCGIDGKAQIEG
jgi:hypothetical protein